MKKILLLLLFITTSSIFSQDIVGKWKTLDSDNKGQSIVEIYEKNGLFYGKIIKVLNKEGSVCNYCTGKYKNTDMIGLVILKSLNKENNSYENGEITDPEIDKTYNCTVKLENPNKLKLRGYIGFSLFGRTEYWYRSTNE